MQTKNKLNLLQLLRAIASLLVVLLHITTNLEEKQQRIFLGGFFNFGGAGVDIFFVLSGFIITYTQAGKRPGVSSFSNFLKRRFFRIFPVYWIIITGFLAVQLILSSYYPTPYPIDIQNLVSTYLLLPGHIMSNGVSWTLSYELFFYLLFSLAYLLKYKKLIITLAVLYLLIILVSPMFHILETAMSGILFNPLNLEFFFGVLIALVSEKLGLRFSFISLIGGCLLFIAAGLASNSGFMITATSLNRVVLFGVPSFLIILGLVGIEKTRIASVFRPGIMLGEASYTLYLIHLPLVVAIIKLLPFANMSVGVLHITLFLVVIALCVLSVIFNVKIEKPLIRYFNRYMMRPLRLMFIF